jgi:hypothetical protein
MTTAVVSVLAAASPSMAVPVAATARPKATSYPGGDLISYRNFADASGLSLNGTAAVVTNSAKRRVLRLTNGGFRQAGSAWSMTRVDATKSFTSTFDVYLHRGTRPADGFAFVLQTDGTGDRALGGSGGGLGYRGRMPSVAVEFDIFRNPDDPDANHVAVVRDGHPEAPLSTATVPFPLFRTPFRAVVGYDASAHTLSVWAWPLGAAPTKAALATQSLDLRAALGADAAYAGFTGATGDLTAVQDIMSWRLGA